MEPILVQPPPDQTESDSSADGPIKMKGPLANNQASKNVEPINIEDPEPESEVKVSNNGHEGLKSIITTLAILIMAPLIAIALTAFIFQSYQVDGLSMETTLQNQDRLIVLKLPRTISKLTNHPYVPNRGDVIIFNKNDLAQYDGSGQKKQLVKRVIGLPGERVVIKDGKITVYNKENPNGFNPDTTLPYGKTTASTIALTTCTGEYCDITVPKDSVYVSGDNRGNSLDSRIFGPVAEDDIVGKLILRIFPFNKAKTF